MRFTQTVSSMINYISEAMTRIFGLSDDNYPKTGPVPYSGDDHSHHKD